MENAQSGMDERLAEWGARMTKTIDGFEIYDSGGRSQCWYWRLRRRGRIVADGAEAYSRKADALRAIRALRKWSATAGIVVTPHDRKR